MNETTEAESREIQRLRSGRDWHGYATLDNLDAIAERIRSMLEGRRYTWASCNEGLRDFFPEVRTGQQMEKLIVHDRPNPSRMWQWCARSAASQ